MEIPNIKLLIWKFENRIIHSYETGWSCRFLPYRQICSFSASRFETPISTIRLKFRSWIYKKYKWDRTRQKYTPDPVVSRILQEKIGRPWRFRMVFSTSAAKQFCMFTSNHPMSVERKLSLSTRSYSQNRVKYGRIFNMLINWRWIIMSKDQKHFLILDLIVDKQAITFHQQDQYLLSKFKPTQKINKYPKWELLVVKLLISCLMWLV